VDVEPTAVDTPANTEAQERESPPDDKPSELVAELGDLADDATAWLIEKKWIAPGQTIADLTDKQAADIKARMSNFKMAVKTWKEPKDKKDKDNGNA
jgi:hypothetical protein